MQSPFCLTFYIGLVCLSFFTNILIKSLER
nr:MAG TPA: hypothetical protein [Caudoviricetes sp.]